MARCSNCGKVNPDKSAFCQDCGFRLEAAAPAGGEPLCPACHTPNAVGQNFCKMCGTPMRVAGAPAGGPPPPAFGGPPPGGSPFGAPPSGPPGGFGGPPPGGQPNFGAAPPSPFGAPPQSGPPGGFGGPPAGGFGAPPPSPFGAPKPLGPPPGGQPGFGAPPAPSPFGAPPPAAAPQPGGDGGGTLTCAACSGMSPPGSMFCQHCGGRSLTAAGGGKAAAASARTPPLGQPAFGGGGGPPPLGAPPPAFGGGGPPPAFGGGGPPPAFGGGGPPAPVPGASPAFAKTMAADFGAGGFDAGGQRMPTPAAGTSPAPPSLRPGSQGGMPGGPPQGPLGGYGPPSPFSPPGGPPPQQPPMGMPHSPMAPSHPTPAVTPRAEIAFGRLVAVNRDGSDGKSYGLTGEQIDVGRTEAGLLFADDLYLAPRHARFEKRAGKIIVRALDEINGVFARVKEPVPLTSGDRVLLGKEVFRYEEVTVEERELKPAKQNGTLVFGTPPRSPWGRLQQLITAGVPRDVYYLSKNEVVLGREEGDLTFPDDEFMSRRHAVIAHTAGKVELRDNGSSNGTYIRIKGDRELKTGDLIRMGDQLFRFEAA